MKKIFFLFTCIFIWFFFTAIAMASQPFPDTGQTTCYDENNQAVPCDSIQPGDPYYGQDGHYQPLLPRSYTKLGHGGAVLADSALHVDNGGPWIMTRDNVTGLIWEVKTNANRNDKYSWSNAQSVFISQLNAQNFGGFSDWRLPEIKELSSLVNSGFYNPAIDNAWFPKTVSSNYWSSTTYANYTYSAWLVYFYSGYVSSSPNKSNSYYVRAVRSGHSGTFDNFKNNGDGTVTDTVTGLMWQKETAPETYTWEQALEYAKNLTLAGYTDWRLPNINELQTLVDYSYSPATYPVFRPHTMYSMLPMLSWYWSSTTSAVYTNYSWLVHFYFGDVSNCLKSNSYYVRAVRSGHSDIGKFGSLVVYMEPQGAVNAGAQWRRKDTSTWYDSGYTETKVSVGTYTIEFKVVPGWRPEGVITVIVEADKTVTGKVSYFEQVTGLPGVMMLLLDE